MGVNRFAQGPRFETGLVPIQMHLGYHELRNMLAKFKEDREKRKLTQPASGSAGGPAASGSGRSGDRPRDDYRDRGSGYERHSSSRYEWVPRLVQTSCW